MAGVGGRAPFQQSTPGYGYGDDQGWNAGWYQDELGRWHQQQSSGGGGLPLPARPTVPNATSLPNVTSSLVKPVVTGATGGIAWKVIGKLFDFGGDAADAAIRTRGANQAVQTQVDAQLRAAELLAKAQQEALDLQKQQYQQSRSDMMPWLRYGTSAVNTLGNLMGLAPADIPDVQMPGSGTGAAGPTTAGPGSTTQRGGPPGIDTGHHAIPRPPYSVPPTTGVASSNTNALTRTYVPPTVVSPTPATPPAAPPPQTRATPPSATGQTPSQTAQPNSATMVAVKWPDGSTTRIPTSQLARYISLGAQPVDMNAQMQKQAPQQQPTLGGMY